MKSSSIRQLIEIYSLLQTFTDGCTNKLIGCCIPKHNNNDDKCTLDDGNQLGDYDVILIRIYGKNTEVVIDRVKEIENFKLLNRYGFAPQLLATFQNGLSYEYSDGRPLNKSDTYDEQVWRKIAQRMAEMHRDITLHQHDQSDGARQPMLWSKINKLFDLVPTKFGDPVKQQRFVGSNQSATHIFRSLYVYGFILQATAIAPNARRIAKGI